MGATPGADIRHAEALPAAASVFQTARTFAAALPDDELVLAETIPGGTTTALGVLTALGERPVVSSSLPTNPLARKRKLVDGGLGASGLEPGGADGEPITALRAVGDPVLAAVAGMIVGATESDTDVLLAGGTQMGAAAALARHAGVETALSLATTSFVAADERADIEAHAADFGLDLMVTDPDFEKDPHVAFEGYVAGEGKEGVGMGGALALAEQAGVSLTRVRERVTSIYERLVAPPRQEKT